MQRHGDTAGARLPPGRREGVRQARQRPHGESERGNPITKTKNIGADHHHPEVIGPNAFEKFLMWYECCCDMEG